MSYYILYLEYVFVQRFTFCIFLLCLYAVFDSFFVWFDIERFSNIQEQLREHLD